MALQRSSLYANCHIETVHYKNVDNKIGWNSGIMHLQNLEHVISLFILKLKMVRREIIIANRLSEGAVF